jgi:hypothetical protein
MNSSFAALVFRTAEVSDEALAHGLGVATAGFDVPAPHVLVAELAPGLSAAFYRSGAKKLDGATELDHAIEIFDDELPPALAVRDAAAREGHAGAVVWSIVVADEIVLDDAIRFADGGWERRFVREGDDGLEAGRASPDADEVAPLDVDAEPGSPEEARAIAPHRGSTWLSAELGRPALPALVGALFQADRRVAARLVDPSPEGVARATRSLVATLRRTPGRGARPLEPRAGVDVPPSLAAFAAAYDWADPSDPSDLYREIAIGALAGTLRFVRPADATPSTDAARGALAKDGAYPIATLASGALGGSRTPDALIGLAKDGAALVLADDRGRARPAGPTLGELVTYLALGWKARDAVEEDLIQALMLRARVRVDAG